VSASEDEFDRWVQHTRETTLKGMIDSAIVLSVVPNPGSEADIKYAVELGLSIMLEKPIVLIVMPGRKPPAKLLAVADEVIYGDIDTQQGRDKVEKALKSLSWKSDG
jgi:hypothetical protein